MTKKLLVLTGAGASHDVVDKECIRVNGAMCPPLTKDLFGYPASVPSPDSIMHACLKKHPLALQVGYELHLNKDNGQEQTLERQLLALRENASILECRKYWAMAPYLHDLFSEISRSYLPSSDGLPSNYKCLIDTVVACGCEELLWVNLNYDLFGDCAIRASASSDLESLEDFKCVRTPDGMILRYCKPHGSADWWRRIKFSESFMPEDYREGRYPKKLDEANLSEHVFAQWEDSPEKRSYEVKAGNRSWTMTFPSGFYPAILAPVGHYKYIKSDLVDAIKDSLEGTTSLLCIGFNALDEDVLSLIKPLTIRKLRVINGGYQDGAQVYSRLCNSGAKIHVGEGDAVYDGGFSAFVKSDLRRWLCENAAVWWQKL